MKLKQLFNIILSIFIFISGSLKGADFGNFKIKKEFQINLQDTGFQATSDTQMRFKDEKKKQEFQPFIIPSLLITTGTTLHFSTKAKENFRDWAQSNFAYHGPIDDYIQYAPLVAVYSFNALGIKGKNNFGNRTALALKSILLNELVVTNLKVWTKTQRPSGGMHSFPSGHTSFAFAMAHFMHKEYGEISPWYTIGAYSCATTVGLMRVAKNAHWISDVLAGAGIGMLSTELIYRTHLYKWDNGHVKNFDIFPFQMGNQKGLTMVYTF